MGYLFAITAVFAGAVKGFFGKKTSNHTQSISDAMLFNSIRMIFCVAIGLGISLLSNGVNALSVNVADITSIIMSGVFSALFVVTWLISVKNGAYLMLDVFLMLGVIVPLMGSKIFFNENISLKQWLGVAVLTVAALILCSYNNKIKQKLTLSSLGLLILCGLSCGLTDFSQKIFASENTGTAISTFNLYSYLISFVILSLCFLFTKGKNTEKPPVGFSVRIVVYILIMSVCLFLNSYFQTVAATYLTSAQLFPLSKSLALILSALQAAVFFGEKINLKCVTGVALAFAGILVINL